jgi:hypothetical protein
MLFVSVIIKFVACKARKGPDLDNKLISGVAWQLVTQNHFAFDPSLVVVSLEPHI